VSLISEDSFCGAFEAWLPFVTNITFFVCGKPVQDYVQIFAQQSTFRSLLLLDNFAINHQNLVQQNGNGLP
jgi:hypothetical protein